MWRARVLGVMLIGCGPQVPAVTDGESGGSGSSSGSSTGGVGVPTTGDVPTGGGTGEVVDCEAVCDAPWVFEGDLLLTPESDLSRLHCMREVTGSLNLREFPGPLPIELRSLQVAHSLGIRDNGAVDLTGLECVRRVGGLGIEFNDSLTDIGALAGLVSSPSIFMRGNAMLVDLSPLSNVGDAESFWLSGCPAVEVLPTLPVGTRLASLELSQCDRLTGVDALAGLRGAPKDVALTGLPALTSIAGLAGMWGVGESADTALILEDLPALTSLHGLEGLRAATTVAVSILPGIDSLAPLAGLETVDRLGVFELPALHSLVGLTSLRSIGQLNLGGCEGTGGVGPIVDLTGLAAVTELGKLHVGGNAKLQSFAGLTGLVSGPQEVISVADPALSEKVFAAFVADRAVPSSCQSPPMDCSCL